MMSPRCPRVPPTKWVSIAREFAWRNFMVAWIVIRLALSCWKYRVREAYNYVLDGGVLHIDVLGGPE
jgi:hypothetical protein